MADRYEIAFRSDTTRQGMYRSTWVPGCPLLVEAIQIVRDTQTGDAYLQMKFANVSRFSIGAFRALAHVSFSDGSEETVEVAPFDVDLEPGAVHVPTPHKLRQGDAVSARAQIESVTGSNGEWEPDGIFPAPLPLNATYMFPDKTRNERMRLLGEAGCTSPDAVDTMLYSDHDWWICPCGALNLSRSTCRSCGMTPEELRKLEDEDYLERSADEYLKELGEQERLKAERKKRNQKFGIIGAAAAVVVVVIVIVLAVGASGGGGPLESRLASHTWRSSADPTATYNAPEGTQIDTTFQNGEVKVKWGSIELASGTFSVADDQTINVHNDAAGTDSIWTIAFTGDKQMTVTINGQETTFTAAD